MRAKTIRCSAYRRTSKHVSNWLSVFADHSTYGFDLQTPISDTIPFELLISEPPTHQFFLYGKLKSSRLDLITNPRIQLMNEEQKNILEIVVNIANGTVEISNDYNTVSMPFSLPCYHCPSVIVFSNKSSFSCTICLQCNLIIIFCPSACRDSPSEFKPWGGTPAWSFHKAWYISSFCEKGKWPWGSTIQCQLGQLNKRGSIDWIPNNRKSWCYICRIHSNQ